MTSSKIKRVASISSLTSGGGTITSSYPLGIPYASIYSKIWASLCVLKSDPHPEVSKLATTVVNSIFQKVIQRKSMSSKVRVDLIHFFSPI